MAKKTRIDPDCKNCIHRKTCLNVNPGTFCTSFSSQQPTTRNEDEDPNRAWRTGRDHDE